MKKITLSFMLLMISLTAFTQTFPGGGTPADMQGPGGGTALTCGTANELNLTTTVSGVGTLGTTVLEQVDLDVSHTWSSDVVVFLIAPDGTTQIELTSGNGGSFTDAYTGTQFRDDATTSIVGATAPFTGAYNPEQPLSTFNGVNADGVWTLNVCDAANGDTGTLNNWALTFGTAAPAPNCATSPNPADGSTGVSTGTVTFSWTAPASGPTPTSYQLYAGETSGLEYGLIGTFTTTSADLVINANSLLLYWQVVPLNGGTPADSCPIWSFTTEDPPPPPANDLPGGAITLTLDEGSACGANTIVGISNEGTTNSDAAAVPSCGSYGIPTDRGDLWYVFTAPNTTVTLNTTNLAGFTSIAGTYYTGTPGSLVEAGCTEFGTGWPWELTGLTVSETYYLRVWDYNNDQFGTFDLCGYYVSCTAGEATAEVTTNCDTTGDAFGVVVTFSAENDATGVSDGTTTFPISGGVATAGPYAFGAPVTLNVVHSDMACDFELGTYQVDACPPANDLCADAIMLTVNNDETCTNTTSGTVENATASGEDEASCFGTEDDDVWYSFVATATTHTIDLLNPAGSTTDLYHSLWSGTCGSLTNILCSDPNSSTANGLTIGETYLLRVYTWTATPGQTTTFDVCIGTPPPPPPAPANDDCDNPTTIILNADETCTVVTSGTTVGATASSQADDVSGTPNNDVWFSFVATNASHNISLENITNQGGGTSTSTDMGMGLYELTSDCDNLVFSSTSDPESYTATGLTPGSTYVLRVYGWFSSVQNNTFDVCIQTPPPPAPANDECANAEDIPDTSVTVNGTNVGATDSAPGDACVTGNDVWYSFTTDADGGDITVSIAETGFEYAIYSDCAGTLASTCNTGVTGAPADTTYYIRIGDDGSPVTRAPGTFSLSLGGSALSVDGFDALDSFKYYPNPVENTLTLNAQQNIDTVTMYNILGQEVLRLSPNTVNAEVDMSNLNTGPYFVKVSIQGATKTVRVIKQ